MEEGDRGYQSAVGMQALSENGNAVQEIELVETLERSTNDEDVDMADSGSDSNHSFDVSDEDRSSLEAEPWDEIVHEGDREEDTIEAQEKSDEGSEENVDENVKVTNKEEIKKGKMVYKEIYETVSHLVAESSVRTAYDRVPVIRHMEPNWYKAAVEGKVDILKDYMERPDWPSRLRTALTPAGNSILHIHVAAPRDARSVNPEFLETALTDSELSLRELKNDKMETPLHTAANFGQITAVALFLNKDPSLLNVINVEGDTALHMAARNKQIEVVKHMLEFSNTMNFTTNYAGETPLYLAVQTGCLELVTSMLNTIDTEQQLGSERTGSILQASVLWGNSEMVKKILQKFPRHIDLRDEAGQTAFHYASGIDNDMLRVIITQQGENSPSAAYIQDIEGRTAAHIAAQQNNIDGLKLLMDHFPDCCEITDNQGRNVVHYAAFLGRIEALEFFLRDARFCELINKKDSEGNTPLHLLASSLTDLPYASLKHLQLLLPELKALHLNIYNIKNFTPGDIANAFKVFELEPAYQDVVRDFRAVAPKGGRVKRWLLPLKEHKVDVEAQREDWACNLLKTVKFHMVVSTLIATVSFAAGLGVPGGFNQDTKDNVKGGTAMLGNKAAFRVFLISDCTALTFSLIATLCYFWIALGKGKGSSKLLFFRALEASAISILALMVAFMAGTYSILQPFNTLVAICVVLILSILILSYIIFAYGIIHLRKRINISMLGPHPQKMKSEVLHGQVHSHYALVPSPVSRLLLHYSHTIFWWRT